jgi:Mg/Co/Ni transporter MgtE
VDVSSERGPRRETDRDIKLEEIMRPAVTITPDALEREALKVLLENDIPGVPVVDEEGILVGFVTDGHLLASALPEYLKVMADVSFVSEAGDEWVDYFAGSTHRVRRRAPKELHAPIRGGECRASQSSSNLY